jgi:hypothetical protein
MLAHTVGSSVSRAYQRSDFLEQRRKLLDAWAAFLIERKPARKILGPVPMAS